MKSYERLFIDGRWMAPARDGSFETIDPSSEQIIAKVAAATAEDVDLAVQAARKAFDEGPWPPMSGAERAAVLRRIGKGIRDRLQELAEIEVRDNGKPFPEALWDVGDAAGCFEFYANLAEKLDESRETPVALSDDRFSSVARKEPVGVAGAIIPWNFPMLMAAWKVAPALAAGCTMVLKPSELTPLTALELANIASVADLPPGVLNVLTGLGKDAGAPLAEHAGIDKLAFTGSVPTGSRIMQAAARDIKNVSLELGGKSPFIVFDDSDIEAAVEWIMFGIFWNQGEVCSATSRVLVQRGIYDRLLERLKEETQKLTIGNGLQDGVLLGPIVSKGQYEKVREAVERGVTEGARLVAGGGRPAHLDKGYFMEAGRLRRRSGWQLGLE
ncbi:betaine-aldehyde dehydrogenase [Paraburkholderia youngii]